MSTSTDTTTARGSRRRFNRTFATIALVVALTLGGFVFISTNSSHRAAAATLQPKAIDSYMVFSANVAGVLGEGSTGGPGNIQVGSFQWGVSMSVDAATSLPSGHVTHNPFSITRQIDKASPAFFKAAAAGTIFKSVTIFLTPSLSSTSKNSMTINLYNVVVASDSWNGVTNGVSSTEILKMVARSYQIVYN